MAVRSPPLQVAASRQVSASRCGPGCRALTCPAGHSFPARPWGDPLPSEGRHPADIEWDIGGKVPGILSIQGLVEQVVLLVALMPCSGCNTQQRNPACTQSVHPCWVPRPFTGGPQPRGPENEAGQPLVVLPFLHQTCQCCEARCSCGQAALIPRSRLAQRTTSTFLSGAMPPGRTLAGLGSMLVPSLPLQWVVAAVLVGGGASGRSLFDFCWL